MAKKAAFSSEFAFYSELWRFYSANRGKVRSRYNDLTKKFLAYNDPTNNTEAFLRPNKETNRMFCVLRHHRNCSAYTY